MDKRKGQRKCVSVCVCIEVVVSLNYNMFVD